MIWFTVREVMVFVVWCSENNSNFTCLNYHTLSPFLVNNYRQLLRPEEVEILVCGSPELDMHALQRSTQYDGYAKTDSTIRWAPHASDSEVAGEGMKGQEVSCICVTYSLRIRSVSWTIVEFQAASLNFQGESDRNEFLQKHRHFTFQKNDVGSRISGMLHI